jgi:hypothetical protein
MSRRSTLKRRRERKRRRHFAARALKAQLPLRKVSTAELFAEIQRRTEAFAEVSSGRN